MRGIRCLHSPAMLKWNDSNCTATYNYRMQLGKGSLGAINYFTNAYYFFSY